MPAILNKQTGETITVSSAPRYEHGMWECGDQRFTDLTGSEYAPVLSAPQPTVGPNEFYFLWTIQEQVAIDSLRTTDKVVELFMRRLDDPRTTAVVLTSPAVQAAVAHTVDMLAAQGVIQDKDARIAAILAGVEPT